MTNSYYTQQIYCRLRHVVLSTKSVLTQVSKILTNVYSFWTHRLGGINKQCLGKEHTTLSIWGLGTTARQTDGKIINCADGEPFTFNIIVAGSMLAGFLPI